MQTEKHIGRIVETTEARDKNIGLTMFVARLYTKALDRTYDADGLNYWCDVVLNRYMTLKDVSTTGFFHSQEFQNKKLSDEEYIKVLYRTFLNREYDTVGLMYWTDKLQNGMSRDEALNGFAESKEFGEIKSGYGL